MFVVTRGLSCEVIMKGNICSNFFNILVSNCSGSILVNKMLVALHHNEIIKSLEIKEITNEKNIKDCLERLQNFAIPSRLKVKPTKKAAVLIPLCVKNSQVSLLFTLRKGDLRTHRRQVSFPGGAQNKDENLIETALRETEEELGLSRRDVVVWGHGNSVDTIDYSVLPVIGFIGDISKVNMNPNPGEVEFVFTVPLAHFCDKNNCGYTRFRYKRGGIYIMPVYLNVPCRIWGLTATFTHLFLMSFLPNDYQHGLPIVLKK